VRYHIEMYGELPSDGSMVPASRDERHIFTVSQLNRESRELLEGAFPWIWIEGEISNLARPSSGHWYFSLKDDRAQIRCAMFRGRNQQLGFTPENGSQVLVRGHISLYEARGEFQLIAEQMEEAGAGALQRAFEELKVRLNKEGLFDRKLTPPALPRCIGVITSPSGAAIRDILSVLQRRFPAIPVIIYPTAVQGKAAATEIVAAINRAGQRQECDVLIVARGGGSLEDLWCFNEESVARALFQCPLPIVAGIGHEIDTTIADYVADVRAPTPSGAAELVSPDQNEWQQTLAQYLRRLQNLLQEHINTRHQRLQWLGQRLQQQHPGQQLIQQSQRLDELEQRLQRNIRQRLQQQQLQLNSLHAGLQRHQPLLRINNLSNRFQHLGQRLQQNMQTQLQRCQLRLASSGHALDTVSPLATLDRGYAIIQDNKGTIIRAASSVTPGQKISARLGQGQLNCTVNSNDA
jgi:exodeoxyribonuclease VII large subunit